MLVMPRIKSFAVFLTVLISLASFAFGAATERRVLLYTKNQVGTNQSGSRYYVHDNIASSVEAIKKLGGADAAISLAVSPKAFEQAFRSLRRGGTLVFVALPADNYMQLPIFETVLNGIKIVGSIVGTRLDLAEVFELHADGKTHVIYEKRQLEEVNHAFEEIEKARVAARLVFDMM